MLDEIYIEEDHRSKGIGTKIIQDIIKSKKKVYLWVYKKNNNALRLYENLNFKIINETETRYQMLYNGY